MIKQTLTYEDFIGGKDTEVTVELRFAYTPPAIRLYEQHNPGSKFFVDLNKATEAFSKYMKAGNFSSASVEGGNLEQSAHLLPMLTDPEINEFMLKVVPCMYFETHEGIRLQSDETWEQANESLWVMQLANVTFFTEIFNELNGSMLAPAKVRGQKKEAESLTQLNSTDLSSS